MKKSWPKWGIILGLMVILGAAAALQSGAVSPRSERADAPDKTLSPYFVVLSGDPEKDLLPLKSTRADVKIAGMVAEVKVTQVYQNQGKKALEAIYVFPGSTRAAVNAMRMTVGNRVVEAQIMERQKARETYEQAKKEGKTTSLLEQQRPNVFQMNVANILPGDEVKVEMTYLELMAPEENLYEFVFPTVVGPRYSNQPEAGAPETEKWVQNPYLHEGQPPPYTFGLAVELRSGLPISKLASPSHEVEIKYAGPNVANITLKDEKTGGNKDFVLRYSLAGDKIDAGLLLYPGKDENFFLMMMEPPARVGTEAVVKREYIFIVDISGSMHGFPLDITKSLIQNLVNGLKPHDFFNVLLFESAPAVLSASGSLAATPENKGKAVEFIKEQMGGGGTEILVALKQALNLPRTPGTSRTVVVATDGYVHVEPQVFEMIRENLGAANLFPFGIGTSVNRHIIEGMARAGMGEPFIILNPGEAAKAAARFQKYIESPVLTQIKVKFPGFQTYDVEPLALPDLFALRPLMLLGKYKGRPSGSIEVTGKTAAGDFQQKISVTEDKANADNRALRFLWARQRVQRLVDYGRLLRGKDNAVIKEVTQLGLKYSLMTPYTSFVAVDQVKRSDGKVETVRQPLPLPEGVSDLAVGGGGGPRMAAKLMMPPSRKSDMAMAKGGAYAPESPSDVGARPPAAPKTPATGVQPPAAVKVEIQVTQIKGKLDKALVEKVLQAEAAKLAACCEDAVKKGAKLPQEIILIFKIDQGGKVTGKVLPKPPLGQEAVTQCLSRAIKAITFPAPERKSVEVTVKLVVTVK